jgi:hypothetical protein
MSLIDGAVWRDRARFARAFRDARPFRHVVIDGFFDAAACRRLLADFPHFEARYALNEMGHVGGKAVRMDVREISDAYRELDHYIQTPEFLTLVSEITGIPALLYDPDYTGGGTHENVEGQGLEAHVDFNYHPRTGWHRRLNLIVYLNPEWEDSWGGSLELQSDPWDPAGNEVKRVLPLFNRCVIFETSEASWHGFSRIALPPGRGDLSRKSFAIYLYTRERPDAETAPAHATVYVPEGRPPGVAAGATLTPEIVAEIDQRFTHLRGMLRFLYDREKQFATRIGELEHALEEARAALRVPLLGYALQAPGATGYWADSWCARTLRFAFTPTRAAHGVEFDVSAPSGLARDQLVSVHVGEASTTARVRPGSRQRIALRGSFRAGVEVAVAIDATQAWSPKAAGESADARELAYRLSAVNLQH